MCFFDFLSNFVTKMLLSFLVSCIKLSLRSGTGRVQRKSRSGHRDTVEVPTDNLIPCARFRIGEVTGCSFPFPCVSVEISVMTVHSKYDAIAPSSGKTSQSPLGYHYHDRTARHLEELVKSSINNRTYTYLYRSSSSYWQAST